MHTQGVMVGHDTEYFVFKDGVPVPAHKAGIPTKEDSDIYSYRDPACDCWVWEKDGSKKKVDENGNHFKPQTCYHCYDYGRFFRDGYALEVNSRAEYCRGYAWNAHKEVRRGVLAELEENGYQLSSLPFVDIDREELVDAPQDVQIFGCSPSFDAHRGGEVVKIPSRALSVPFRTAASHFHFSLSPEYWPALTEALQTPESACQLVLLCDFFLGLPSTFLAMGGEEGFLEFKRRSLYGRAGEFRLHEHNDTGMTEEEWEEHQERLQMRARPPQKRPGFEYRVCSTHMARHSALYNWAWGTVRDVVIPLAESIYAGTSPPIDEVSKDLASDLSIAINTGKGLDLLMKEFIKALKPVLEVWCSYENVYGPLGYSKKMDDPDSRLGYIKKWILEGPSEDQFKMAQESLSKVPFDEKENQERYLIHTTDGHYGTTTMFRSGFLDKGAM